MNLQEYINEKLTTEEHQEILGVEPNHSFTDRNGTHHENGYIPLTSQ